MRHFKITFIDHFMIVNWQKMIPVDSNFSPLRKYRIDERKLKFQTIQPVFEL
jgi:hypothetical protein